MLLCCLRCEQGVHTRFPPVYVGTLEILVNITFMNIRGTVNFELCNFVIAAASESFWSSVKETVWAISYKGMAIVLSQFVYGRS